MKKPNYPKVRRYPWQIICVVVIFASFCLAPFAHALNIYPGNSYWQAAYKDRESKENSEGKVYISGNNPRSGNGSLTLEIINPTVPANLGHEWAFYNRYAGNDKTGQNSWGLLSQVSAISFDWYRQAILYQNPYLPYDPWLAQTPVLRLYVNDGGVLSELVWEKYYTDSSSAVTNQWVSQNVMGQNLWRHFLPDGNSINYADDYAFNALGDADPYDGEFPDGATNMPSLMTKIIGSKNTAGSWLDSGFSDQFPNMYSYSANAYVYGIGVGVGSFWPDRYVGYVDNVLLAFNNGVPVVNDNFEVPEPSSLDLLAYGLALLASLALMRKRRKFREMNPR
jgi:hypothetical protein